MTRTKVKPKLLVVGSLVMDLTVSAPRFPKEGETVLGLDFSAVPGGKGANQAIQAALLGADVTMCGRVGNDDYGRRLLQSCTDAGIDVSRIGITDAAPTAVGNVQLEVGPGGSKNRIIVVAGANMTLTPQDVEFLRDEMNAYDMVMLQLEIPMEVNEQVAAYAAAAGVPVMLNTAPYAPLPAALMTHLTYISPNEHEAANMTGIPIRSITDAEAATRSLMDMGAQNVLITLGRAGAVFRSRDGFLYSPAVDSVKAADPTAAGDSFVGAFCTAVSRGVAIQDALAYANCAASITVSRHGAQSSLPSAEEVKAFQFAKPLAVGT